jgi:hypothetical protein
VRSSLDQAFMQNNGYGLQDVYAIQSVHGPVDANERRKTKDLVLHVDCGSFLAQLRAACSLHHCDVARSAGPEVN